MTVNGNLKIWWLILFLISFSNRAKLSFIESLSFLWQNVFRVYFVVQIRVKILICFEYLAETKFIIKRAMYACFKCLKWILGRIQTGHHNSRRRNSCDGFSCLLSTSNGNIFSPSFQTTWMGQRTREVTFQGPFGIQF